MIAQFHRLIGYFRLIVKDDVRDLESLNSNLMGIRFAEIVPVHFFIETFQLFIRQTVF